MIKKHPEAFLKYGAKIETILANPDYVAMNGNDDSIEFVKDFKINDEYVKVAVRVSKSGRFFVRSLYILNPKRVYNFIKKGTLKKI